MLATATGPADVLGIAVILALKLVLPVLIVFFPFAAGWANFVLDSVDGDLLIPLGLANATYQPIDKLTDWATYIAMVVHAYRRDWPIKKLVLALFCFRSIGQVAFLLSGNEIFLAVFPNFLEPLFLVVASILAWKRVVRRLPNWQEQAFATLRRHRWLIGVLVVVYKLQDEYFTHVGNLDRTEFLQNLFGG
jgi:hypothetical protein